MKKNNCINLIRMIAALQVFYGHATAHLTIKKSGVVSEILSCFQGVPIFFVLSGFLIWMSLDRRYNFCEYTRRRILRLYPELVGGVLISVISIVILYKNKINWPMFIVWIFTQCSFFQFWTPDFLRGFGCGTPNGSLWTIGVMLQSYVAIWLAYKWLHKKSVVRWGVIFLFAIMINALTPYLELILPTIIYKLFIQTFVPYIWMFILGAFFSEYSTKCIEYLKKYCFMLFFGSVFINIFLLDIGIYGTLTTLLLGSALIGFAYKFPQLNIKPDISYGFYIYHMIVINVLIELGKTEKMIYLVLAFVLTLALSVLSYMAIGTSVSKWKNKAS